jgi:hypothetical protein
MPKVYNSTVGRFGPTRSRLLARDYWTVRDLYENVVE